MKPVDIKSNREKSGRRKGTLLGSDSVTATSGRILFFFQTF